MNIKTTPQYISFEVKVQPKAKKNEIIIKDGRIIIKVTAPPDKGKANEAVIKLIADKLDIKKSDVFILRGETNQNKVIGIKVGASGRSPLQIQNKLIGEGGK